MDNERSARYETLSRRFPHLLNDKEVWNLIASEKLFALNDAAFEVKMAELQAQTLLIETLEREILEEQKRIAAEEAAAAEAERLAAEERARAEAAAKAEEEATTYALLLLTIVATISKSDCL